MHIQQLLREYLELHGYWVLFLGTFLEGEAILIMAGFLAFQGYLDIRLVILTALCGSFLGDQFYFYLGYFKGKPLMRRFHSIARKFREALRLIEKYGSLVAFFSRFTYGFRIILPMILGITSLPPKTFIWINLISALTWSIIFSLAGFLFGKSASLFLEDVSKTGCKVRFSHVRELDTDREYTLTVLPALRSGIAEFSLTVIPQWISRIEDAVEIGFAVLPCPGIRHFSRYVDILADLEEDEDVQEAYM